MNTEAIRIFKRDEHGNTLMYIVTGTTEGPRYPQIIQGPEPKKPSVNFYANCLFLVVIICLLFVIGGMRGKDER